MHARTGHLGAPKMALLRFVGDVLVAFLRVLREECQCTYVVCPILNTFQTVVKYLARVTYIYHVYDYHDVRL